MTSGIVKRDLVTGLVLLALGALAAGLAAGLPLGTMQRPGPGIFPLVIAIHALILGAAIVLRNDRGRSHPAHPSISALQLSAVPAAVIAFGVLIERAGMLLAGMALIAAVSLASRRRVIESIILAAALSSGAVVVFVWLLGLAVDVLPRGWPPF